MPPSGYAKGFPISTLRAAQATTFLCLFLLSLRWPNALRVSRREYELTDDGTARDASRLHALVRPPRYPYPCRLLNRPSGHAEGGPSLPVAKAAGSLDAPSRMCERVSHLYSSSCSSYHLFVSFSVITQVA